MERGRAKRAGRTAAAIVGLGALVATPNCRAPTQVTVVVYTDLPCGSPQTVIRVGTLDDALGHGPRIVDTHVCSGGRIGSLVVVPSGSREDEVGIWVATRVGGGDAGTCDEHGDYDGCIVARRAVHYVEHSELDLPIDLRLDCANVKCDSPQTTCVHGACVSDRVDDPSACHGDGCRFGVGGVDAGPADAPPDTHGGVDAAKDGASDVLTDGTDGPDGADGADGAETGPVAAEWAYSYGGRVQFGGATAAASDGSVVAAFSFTGTVDVGGSKTTKGSDDVIVVRYSPGGAVEWVRQIGGDDTDEPRAVALDADGSIVLLGHTKSASLDVAGGASIGGATTAGIFLARISGDGASVSGQRYDGGYMDYTAYLGLAPTGEIFVGLGINAFGVVKWDGASHGSGSSNDVVLGKFPAKLGVPLAIRTFADPTTDEILDGMTMSPRGPILTGAFDGPLDGMTASAGLDGFILGLDFDLATRWRSHTAETGGGEHTQTLEGVAALAGGKIAVTGTLGAADLDVSGLKISGPGTPLIVFDDVTGAPVTGRVCATGYGIDDVLLAADASGANLTFAGRLRGTTAVSFDPSLGSVTPNGIDNAVLVRFDATLRGLSQRQLTGDVAPEQVSVDSAGYAALVGALYAKSDFGFTTLTPIVTAPTEQAFVARIGK